MVVNIAITLKRINQAHHLFEIRLLSKAEHFELPEEKGVEVTCTARRQLPRLLSLHRADAAQLEQRAELQRYLRLVDSLDVWHRQVSHQLSANIASV